MQEENGFIFASNLSKIHQSVDFLRSIPFNALLAEVNDGGVVLLANLEEYCRQQFFARKQRNQEWACKLCTFVNFGNVSQCEMCGSQKASIPIINFAVESEPAVKEFLIFHFNGINQVLSTLLVNQNLPLIPNMGFGNTHCGLREILQTKWKCEIDYCDAIEPTID